MIIINFYENICNMNNLEQFKKIPLFDDLDEHALKSLADRAQIQKYAPDERIISQSDDVQAFFVVLAGRVKIFRSNAEGKEQIMYIVEEGQPFCFCTAFTNHPYPVNVNALEESIVSSIPAQHMEDIARKEPLLLLKIMQILTRRLLDSMNMIESLSLHGITKRVASFLLLAESTSPAITDHPGFILSISHKDISKIVGTTPETLSRVIQGFRRDEIIHASGKYIQILDMQSLQREAE